MVRKLEQEEWSRVDNGRDRANDRAALRTGTPLLLLLGLLLLLLGLLDSLAGLPARRFASISTGTHRCRHEDGEDHFPLHDTHVTTPQLNGK